MAARQTRTVDESLMLRDGPFTLKLLTNRSGNGTGFLRDCQHQYQNVILILVHLINCAENSLNTKMKTPSL